MVIADVDKNLYVSRISKDKITSKTKAVILVHMLGQEEMFMKLKKFVIKKISLIEDNCESFGAKVNNILLGNLGDVGALV